LERYNKDVEGEDETGETYCNVRQEKLEQLERYNNNNKSLLSPHTSVFYKL
jgi:hypothetical protein